MKKHQNTKRALLMSVLSLLLCVSMLIGTTFAWFTDTVTSAGNIIKSGSLDIEMWYSNDNASWANANEGTIFDYQYWEPGYTEVKYIKIQNVGDLAFKYQMNIIPTQLPAADEADLAEVIDVYVFDGTTTVTRAMIDAATPVGTLADLIANGAAEGYLLPAEGKGSADYNQDITAPRGELYYCIALKMQESAGNEYQNKTVGNGFKVQLLATQDTWEDDSFDHYYDGAANPWDGTADYSWYDAAATEYVIYTAEQLAGLAGIVNGTADGIAIDSFAGKTVKLGTNINLGGKNWTPIGDVDADEYVGFRGTFDGQNFAIYDLKIESASWGQGLFGYMEKHATIQNLEVQDAYISAEDTSGVIAGYAVYGTFSNIHVSGDVIVTGAQHMGGIVGNGYFANFSNCSVVANAGSSITGTTGSMVGGIVGYHGEGNLTIANCAVEGLKISGYTMVGGITGLASASNTITGCSVKNVELVKTREGKYASVGFIAGTYTYNANKPVTITDCVVEGTSLNGNYENRNTSAESLFYGYEYAASTDANFVMSNNSTNNCVDNLVKLVKYENVSTWDDLQAAVSAGKNIKLNNDISGATTINLNGGILDGNGYTMTFTASGFGQVVINPTGGTIKNVTIVNPNANMFDDQWAIGSMQMCDTTLTQDLYLENVDISGFQLALDMKANGHSVYVKDSEITNWMQINGAEIVSFEGCHFKADVAGQMTFNQPSSQQAIIFLMGNMSFTDCHFEENVNIYLDTTRYTGAVHFNNSTYGNNGVEDRPIDSFGFIQWWFPATGVYGYAGTFGDTKPTQTHFDWYINGTLVWDATAV